MSSGRSEKIWVIGLNGRNNLNMTNLRKHRDISRRPPITNDFLFGPKHVLFGEGGGPKSLNFFNLPRAPDPLELVIVNHTGSAAAGFLLITSNKPKKRKFLAFLIPTMTGASHLRKQCKDARIYCSLITFGSAVRSINVTSKAVFLTFFVSSQHWQKKTQIYPRILRRTFLLHLSTQSVTGKGEPCRCFLQLVA